MANESNKEKKDGNNRVRRAGGLAASYFVSKYLARIVSVCRGCPVARIRTVRRENLESTGCSRKDDKITRYVRLSRSKVAEYLSCHMF